MTKSFIPGLSSWKNIEVSAQNVITVCDNTMAPARDTLQKILSYMDQKSKAETKGKVGGEKSAQLLQQYASMLSLIAQYRAKITSKQSPNSANLVAYLDNKLKPVIQNEQNK